MNFVVYYEGADYDLFCRGNNIASDGWKAASLAYAANGYRIIKAQSVQDAVDQILGALPPNSRVGEIQFWGHGASPAGVKVGQDSGITASDFSAGGHGDSGNDHAALTRLKPALDSESLLYFRACGSFRGDAGKEFAKQAAKFFQCRVGGHIGDIGFTQPQPGYRELSPGGDPAKWPTPGYIESRKMTKP